MKHLNAEVIKTWLADNNYWAYPLTLIAVCFEIIMLLLMIVAGMPFWAFLAIHCAFGIIGGFGWLMENGV